MAIIRMTLLMFAAVGAFAWLAWDQLSPAPAVATNEIVEIRLGESALRVEASLMARDQDRLGGRLDELRLTVDASSFGPAPPLRPLPPDAREAMPDLLHLSLTPADRDLPPADRTSTLYSRFLDADSAPSVAGLRVRRFEGDSPYQGEDLYFYPPEGRLFAARCLRQEKEQGEAPGDDPGTCLAYVRAGDIDVRMRFSGTLIERWERLSEGVQGLVASLRK